jgi:hypothetical protein
LYIFYRQENKALVDDQQAQNSHSGFFANSRSLLVTGGIFVSLSYRWCKQFSDNCINFILQNNINMLPANISERQINIPMPQKPDRLDSSALFTGRRDVLDKLRKIFVPRTNNGLLPRRSCLLWGMGGIGKTQICLKFTEEMSDR